MENMKESFVGVAQEDRNSTIMRRRVRSEGGIMKERKKKQKNPKRREREAGRPLPKEMVWFIDYS